MPSNTPMNVRSPLIKQSCALLLTANTISSSNTPDLYNFKFIIARLFAFDDAQVPWKNQLTFSKPLVASSLNCVGAPTASHFVPSFFALIWTGSYTHSSTPLTVLPKFVIICVAPTATDPALTSLDIDTGNNLWWRDRACQNRYALVQVVVRRTRLGAWTDFYTIDWKIYAGC